VREPDHLPLPEMTALFAEFAFYWTRFADVEPFIDALDRQKPSLSHPKGRISHPLPVLA